MIFYIYWLHRKKCWSIDVPFGPLVQLQLAFIDPRLPCPSPVAFLKGWIDMDKIRTHTFFAVLFVPSS